MALVRQDRFDVIDAIAVLFFIAAAVTIAVSVHSHPIPSRCLLAVFVGGLIAAIVEWFAPRVTSFAIAGIGVVVFRICVESYPAASRDSWLVTAQIAALMFVGLLVPLLVFGARVRRLVRGT